MIVIVLVEYIINGDNKGYFIEIKNETKELTLPLVAVCRHDGMIQKLLGDVSGPGTKNSLLFAGRRSLERGEASRCIS